MEIYFSHSYRDVAINSYFIETFIEEELPLRADQKSDVWCVAKLERYLHENTGFISVIPKRPTEMDPAAYSLYIGQELGLARRAQVQRLLFVDEDVFKRHRLDFPEDAVTFNFQEPAAGQTLHSQAIRDFTKRLETVHRMETTAIRGGAAVVAGEGKGLLSAADDLAEVLRREQFSVTMLSGRRPARGLDDIRLLEMLRKAELCVFLLGERLSEAHIALAMAHAHCIPSVRLQYDIKSTDTAPSLTGVIRWKGADDMLVEFSNQLSSYKDGLVQPVDMTTYSNSENAARSVGTMKRRRLHKEDIWQLADGPDLVDHVFPDHTFVRDEVDRVRAQMNTALGLVESREATLEMCALLYSGIARLRFGYEIEQPTGIAGTQAIRSPRQIAAHETATCIDIACLFAALLESCGQNPLIVVLQGPQIAHALAGYRVRGEPVLQATSISDILGALARRDVIFFEATGVLAADKPVGAELPAERQNKLLPFADARAAATRMLKAEGMLLKHFVDILAVRLTRR